MGKGKRVQNYDISIPPKEFTDSEARALWSDLSPIARREIVRAAYELSEGTAIVKDHGCGRRACDPAGFWGLERAERALYTAETNNAPASEIAALKDGVELLRHGLASDIAFIESWDALEPYHRRAEAEGQRLADVIGGFVETERLLHTDPIAGIFMLCERVGIDPLQMLAHFAQQPVQPEQQVTH